MVGPILRNARKHRKLTLVQVAELCSSWGNYLSAGHLSDLENENKPLIPGRVYSLSKTLEIDMDCLEKALEKDRMMKCPWHKDCELILRKS